MAAEPAIIVVLEDMAIPGLYHSGESRALVVSAKTCEDAAQLVVENIDNLQAVIVDLTVPQGQWMSACRFGEPGLAFISYLQHELGVPADRIAVLSFLIDEHRSSVLMRQGIAGRRVYRKSDTSLFDVVDEIRGYRSGELELSQ